MKNFSTTLIFIFYASFARFAFATAPFELTHTHPDHPDFQQNIMGLYGVNTAIEPEKVSLAEKGLYEKVLPHLDNNPNHAIEILVAEITKENNAAFDLWLAILYYQNNDHQSSLLWLNKALEKVPNFRRALYIKSLIHFQKNDYKNCIKNILKVIQLGGRDARQYGLLAYCYLNLEKYASALEAYQSAKMFDPNNSDFKKGLAYCYLSLHDYTKAIGYFEELIQDNPEDTSLWLAQSNAFLAEERHDDAIANLEIVRSMNKANTSTLLHLSQIYTHENIENLSVTVLKEAIQQLDSSEHYKKIVRTIELYLSKQWYEASQTILQSIPETVIKKQSDPDKLLLDLAKTSLNLSLNRRPAAYQSLSRILKKDPLNGAALLLMGKYYQEEQQLEEAIFHYERAAQLEKVQYKSFFALGQLYVEQGNFNDALKVLYQAQQLKPTSYLLNYIQQVEKAYQSAF
jgi:tetratricopeptide (TPR) repeat protein